MQLTKHTDYSLRLLIYLAISKQGSTVGEIAESYGISKNHLVKVAHELVKLGFVEATRGKSGGLRLALPPEQILVSTVVSQMEPHLNLVECFAEPPQACPISGLCNLRHALKKAGDAFMDVLADYTLADLAKNRGALRRALSVD